MIKKGFLFLSFTLSIFLISISASADEFDNFLAELEAYKKEMQKSYYPVTESQYVYLLDRHFTFASVDHKAASVGLSLLSTQEGQRLSAMSDRFELIRREISETPQSVDTLAAEMFSLFSEAQLLKGRAKIYVDDLQVLKNSWDKYCDEKHLQDIERYFNPLSVFRPEGDLGYFSAPDVPFSFEVNVSMNENGDIANFHYQGGVGEQEQSGEMTDDEKWAVASTVAFAACSAATPAVGLLCAAGVYALKFLIDIFTLGKDVADLARKKEKQFQLLEDIYYIQSDAIKKLATTSVAKTKENCAANFVLENKWPEAQLTQHQKKADALYETMNTYINEDFKDIQAEHYDYLKNVYFRDVVKNYVANIQSYFADKVLLNQKVIDFVQKDVVSKIEKVQSSSSAIAKTLAEQSLWDQLILGDALYREAEGFLGPHQGSTTSFPNRWEELSRQILIEVAP